MNNAPHVLTSSYNQLDAIGLVHGDFYSIMSASGPVKPIYDDRGPVEVGMNLRLPYNYATDEYATQNGGWPVTVIRINRKSVTVKAQDGKSYRIEFTY